MSSAISSLPITSLQNLRKDKSDPPQPLLHQLSPSRKTKAPYLVTAPTAIPTTLATVDFHFPQAIPFRNSSRTTEPKYLTQRSGEVHPKHRPCIQRGGMRGLCKPDQRQHDEQCESHGRPKFGHANAPKSRQTHFSSLLLSVRVYAHRRGCHLATPSETHAFAATGILPAQPNNQPD